MIGMIVINHYRYQNGVKTCRSQYFQESIQKFIQVYQDTKAKIEVIKDGLDYAYDYAEHTALEQFEEAEEERNAMLLEEDVERVMRRGRGETTDSESEADFEGEEVRNAAATSRRRFVVQITVFCNNFIIIAQFKKNTAANLKENGYHFSLHVLTPNTFISSPTPFMSTTECTKNSRSV